MKTIHRLVLILLFLTSTQVTLAAEGQAEQPILLLGAVPQEITFLVDQLGSPVTGELAGVPYWQGTLQGRDVIVAITGVGKSYTAMTTTLFIRQFSPRMALMTGTGARINPELRTGDVIVPATLHFHDSGSLTSEGMVFRGFKSPAGGTRVDNRFGPGDDMLDIAKQAISVYQSETVVIDERQYQNRVRLGVVATSDLFGVTEGRISQLKSEFDTDIMEMESAAFALVCESFDVPYLVVRAGSNKAQEAPNNDYLVLGPIAADKAARFTYHLLRFL